MVRKLSFIFADIGSFQDFRNIVKHWIMDDLIQRVESDCSKTNIGVPVFMRTLRILESLIWSTLSRSNPMILSNSSITPEKSSLIL